MRFLVSFSLQPEREAGHVSSAVMTSHRSELKAPTEWGVCRPLGRLGRRHKRLLLNDAACYESLDGSI